MALEAWDPPAVAAARRDDLRPALELADEFAALRADSVGLVRGLSAEDLPRFGNHPEVGPLRVDELLGEWVHHDRNHIRQLLEVTQRRVWDQMGNARRFSLAGGLSGRERPGPRSRARSNAPGSEGRFRPPGRSTGTGHGR